MDFRLLLELAFTSDRDVFSFRGACRGAGVFIHFMLALMRLYAILEDDSGELSEEMKKFVEICELLIDDKMFAKYRWCGNGRPPSSRIAQSIC